MKRKLTCPLSFARIAAACCLVLFSAQAESPQGKDSLQAPGAVEETKQEDAPIYLGLRQEMLFNLLGIESIGSGIGNRCVNYSLKDYFVDVGLEVGSIHLSVRISIEEAELAHMLSERLVTVWYDEKGDSIGSEYTLWYSDHIVPGGTLFVREKNILIQYIFSGTDAAAKSFAQRIVDAIRSDRDMAPLGTWESKPKIMIEELPISKSAPVDESVKLDPKIAGFRSSRLRYAIIPENEFPKGVALTDEGELLIPNELAHYSDRFELVVVDEMNVFVIKELELR